MQYWNYITDEVIMKQDMPHAKALSKSVNVFAGLTGLMALIVLLSWFIGKTEFITLGHDFKPMAVTTAFLLFLLSSSIFLHQKWPSNPTVNYFSFTVIFITVCISLIVGLQFSFAVHPDGL